MRRKPYKAFTLVEVAVTIVVAALIVGTSMTILDNLIGAMADIRLHTDAFETARQNMETLLSVQNVRDKIEYGISEIHPEIQWQTAIEPFYEPITNAMWIRAICSAGYTDSKGTYQEVELEHWLTNLPANVVRQIIQQQKMEEEYLDLLSGTASGQAEAALQETTIAFLEEEGLNVDAYMSFLERQRRRKLEYIARHGFDDGYEDFVEQMRQDENDFLEILGMDMDEFNDFARNYVPRSGGTRRPGGTSGTGGTGGGVGPGQSMPDGGGNTSGPDGATPQPRPDDRLPTRKEMEDRNYPDWLIDLIERVREKRG